MSSKLLIHAKTLRSMVDARRNNTHAIILSGPEGSGKATLAAELVRMYLGLDDVSSVGMNPFFLSVAAQNSTIGIDQIRDIQRFLSLKTTGSAQIRRAVIIHEAHSMTNEAQNSLLKALEEPPADTVIVLATKSLMSVLPTIRSRTHAVDILPASKNEAFRYFTEHGFSETAINKAYILSEGYAGLMHDLLTNDDQHQLIRQVDLAKQLLTAEPFVRLKKIDDLIKNKEEFSVLLYALRLVCKAALNSSTKLNPQQSKKLILSLRTLLQTENDLSRNANNKLLLTHLFLHL